MLTKDSDIDVVKTVLDIRCCNRLSCFCLENALVIQRSIGADLRRILTSGNAGDALVEYLTQLENS